MIKQVFLTSEKALQERENPNYFIGAFTHELDIKVDAGKFAKKPGKLEMSVLRGQWFFFGESIPSGAQKIEESVQQNALPFKGGQQTSKTSGKSKRGRETHASLGGDQSSCARSSYLLR